MMKRLFIFTFVLLLAVSASAQLQHFEPVDPTGQAYNVSARGIYIEGLALQIGDEVGVFDGDLCVGAKAVTQPVNVSSGQSLQVQAQEGDTNLQLPGFTAGNTINVVVWQIHNDTEVDITEDWALGDGTFGFGIAAIMHPIFHGDQSIAGPSHFLPVEPADPTDIFTPAYGVVVESAMLDGANLEPGDEIAVYDGDTCVGAAKLSYEIGDHSLTLITWGEYNEAPGYTAGNPLLMRIWDSSTGMEYDGLPEFFQGGSFESDPFAIISLLDASDVDNNLQIVAPVEFELVAAYPNPFNGMLNLQLALPRPGEVTLSAWDVLGRHVSTLSFGQMMSGSHTLTWNAENLPSGSYFLHAATSYGSESVVLVTLLK